MTPKESEGSAPGEKPQFLGIREQRVTNVMIGVAIGLSTLITPILALIPMPVLYGIFLYMGVSSLKVQIQLFKDYYSHLIMYILIKKTSKDRFIKNRTKHSGNSDFKSVTEK
jgi:hypothetical protein